MHSDLTVRIVTVLAFVEFLSDVDVRSTVLELAEVAGVLRDCGRGSEAAKICLRAVAMAMRSAVATSSESPAVLVQRVQARAVEMLADAQRLQAEAQAIAAPAEYARPFGSLTYTARHLLG